MSKRILTAALLAIPVLLAGCIQQRTIVVVNPDGSGNIVLSQMFSKEAVQMMGGMMSGLQSAFSGGDTNAAEKKEEKDPFYDEEEFKKLAPKFGEGVEYLKATKMEKDGAKGAVVAYKFADVTKLKIDPSGSMKEAGGSMGKSEDEKPKAEAPQIIRFGFEKGATSKLSVLLPDEMKKALEERKGAAAAKPAAKADEKEASPDKQMAAQMAAQMFKGMRMTVQVEVKGQVVKTTASHPDAEKPTRFTIMDFNFDEILKNSANLLAEGPGADTMKNLVMAGEMPGLVVETNTAVTVEFK
jgi:hypothetical protein